MTIWIDAQLSPALAGWLKETFQVEAFSLRELGLRDALDPEIFAAAKAANVVVMTKDADFPEMVKRLGAPPQVIWLRCGNTSNKALQELLAIHLPGILQRLQTNETIVELP